MNKEKRIELGNRWGEVLTKGDPCTRELLIKAIQLRENITTLTKKGVIQVERSKYDIVVKDGGENVFFLKKDTNDDYLKRPNGEELKVLKLFYDNQIPSFKYEENGAFIMIDVWGENNEDENNILDFPLVRLIR